jgi:hypothetical protein
MEIFGRHSTDDHALGNALEALLGGSNIEDRAMACNFMHDHRVIPLREQEYLPPVPTTKGLTAAELQNHQVDYFKYRIRFTERPGFEEPANCENLVEYNPHRKLLRLVDMNGMDLVFSYARESAWKASGGAALFKNYPLGDGPNGERVQRWLDRHLDAADEDAKLLVGSMLELLEYRKGDASLKKAQRDDRFFHPQWVTPFDERKSLEFLRTESADRWLERVGIGGLGGDSHWIVALAYTPRSAGLDHVYRPTILDCNWDPRHHPSPKADPKLGGHPVDLGCASQELESEFLHRQAVHTPADFTDLGCLRKRTQRQSPADLATQRRHHLDLIRRMYPSLEEGWMAECYAQPR